MARTKGAKGRATGSRFKNFEGEKPFDIHIRLTRSMLTSKNYQNISASAFRLYCHMKLIAKGKDEFEFATSCAVGKGKIFKSNSTFVKARDELIKNGFIDYTNKTCAKYKRHTSKFKFLDKWWNY